MQRLHVAPRQIDAVADAMKDVNVNEAAKKLDHPLLSSENDVLSKLLYKAKNQQRKFKHFNKLCKVKKLLNSFLNASTSLNASATSFMRAFEDNRNSRRPHVLSPSQAECAMLCEALLHSARSIKHIVSAVLSAATPVGQLVSHSVFLAQATVMLALLSRVFCLLKFKLHLLAQWYNHFVSLLPCLPSDGRRKLVKQTCVSLPARIDAHTSTATHALLTETGQIQLPLCTDAAGEWQQQEEADALKQAGSAQQSKRKHPTSSLQSTANGNGLEEEDLGAPVAASSADRAGIAAFAKEDRKREPVLAQQPGYSYTYVHGPQTAALGEDEDEDDVLHDDDGNESGSTATVKRSKKQMRALEKHATASAKHANALSGKSTALANLTRGLL